MTDECKLCGRDEGHHIGCAKGPSGKNVSNAMSFPPDPKNPNVTPEEAPGNDEILINPDQADPLPSDQAPALDVNDPNEPLSGQHRHNEADDKEQAQALEDTTDAANENDEQRETVTDKDQVKENHRLQNLSDEELAKEKNEAELREENSRRLQETKPDLVTEKHETEPVAPREQCAFAGCTHPKASAAKNAKYCEDHKDPKNRKE